MKEKMMFILLILSLLSLGFCEYKKLSKYSSVKVAPKVNVYLDLSSFKTGDLISLEIGMDLFFGGNTKTYEFYIDQVPASSYYDSKYWNSLRKVKNSNVTCSRGDYCTFTWEEIKKEESTYIYIIPPEPFSDFYTFWGYKIKIINTGGLSTGEIVGIVLGVVGFLVILGIIIYCCCYRKRYYGIEVPANNTVQQPAYQPPVQNYQSPGPIYQPPGPAYQTPVQPYPQGIPLNQPVYSNPPIYNNY
jgi:hypothetical protein